jgi:SOS-response transcriptional repressor LexA
MGLQDNLREIGALRRLLEATQKGEEFGRQVRSVRNARGLTLDALAAATGIAKSYLSQIETGYAAPPRDEKVRRIAAALGLDEEGLVAAAHLSQLPVGLKERMASLSRVFDSTEEMIRALLASRAAAGESGDTALNHGMAPPLDLDALHRSGLLHHLAEWGDDRAEAERGDLRRVPVINKVAAGQPQEFTDLGYPVGVADEYVGAPAELTDPHAFAVRVEGDSMEPKYHEGDIVLFSPAADVRPGDDCFVRFAMIGGPRDGEITFKRVFYDAEDVIRLQPINERYAPMLAKPGQIAGIFRAVARYEKL